MEYRLDRTEILARCDIGEKLLFIHVVADIQIGQIDELGAVFQVVDDQNIADAAIVERLDDIAANHSCAASDDNHVLYL